MKFALGFVAVLLLSACSSSGSRQPQSLPEAVWVLDQGADVLTYDGNAPLVGQVSFRSGYFREAQSPFRPLKGCILYLQGLADSMLNHDPYFTELSRAGYRVVAFDYMGQGGSGGTMNHTRVVDPLTPSLQISSIAERVWAKHAAACPNQKPILLGWSTGGLAAYEMAVRGRAEAVILLAPGLAPKKFVGESATQPSLLARGAPVITLRTLTRNRFEGAQDPHVDPVKPDSPAKVPLFAVNLLASAQKMRGPLSPSLPDSVPGIAFISSGDDTYIDRTRTIAALRRKAPHMRIVSFEGSLHEIDNELEDVSSDLRRQTLEFLDSLRPVSNELQ
jgi:alpha-beta hydrolase superfamily lysophospholipase